MYEIRFDMYNNICSVLDIFKYKYLKAVTHDVDTPGYISDIRVYTQVTE